MMLLSSLYHSGKLKGRMSKSFHERNSNKSHGYAIRSFSTVSEKEILLSRFWNNFDSIFSSYMYIFLIFLKQRVLQLFPLRKRISPKVSIYIYFFCYLILFKIFYSLGYLFMDELHQAVTPFLHPSGGMSGSEGNMGGGSGGSGWTSFDLGVLAEDSNENGEEVTQPNLQNAPANQVEAVLPEPDMDSVKGVIKNRLTIYRLGQRNSTVDDSEIDRIVSLKNDILNRMFELDPSPFWNTHRNRLLRDYIQPPRGGEYRIPVLEAKLDSLFGENPATSLIYKQLLKWRDSFDIDAPFRGPRGH